MIDKELEKNVEQLLCSMKSELDGLGVKPEMRHFDFAKARVVHYVNAPDEEVLDREVPEGEARSNLKKITNMRDNEITAALNFCCVHSYIDKLMFENYVLTEKGKIHAFNAEKKANLHKKWLDWSMKIIVGVTIFILGNVSMFFIKKWIK